MIAERFTFDLLAERLKAAAVVSRRLPEQVFQAGYHRFFFIEFELFSGKEFWTLVQNLAAFAQDDRIAVTAIEPSAEDYFFKEFGVFGAIELDANVTPDRYFEELSSYPDSSPADALLHNSEVLAWFSKSMNWLIWGERSRSIAILGLREHLSTQMYSLANSAGVKLFSAEEALTNLISTTFIGYEVPMAWKQEFLANYSD
jgi:hypothetical protein